MADRGDSGGDATFNSFVDGDGETGFSVELDVNGVSSDCDRGDKENADTDSIVDDSIVDEAEERSDRSSLGFSDEGDYCD